MQTIESDSRLHFVGSAHSHCSAATGNEELELTILMPCLNEADTIGTCVEKAIKFLTEHRICGEVLVADNGSTDGSQTIAETRGARIVPIPDRGYGAALIGGTEAARGRYVIMADSDDSYDLSALMPFLERLRGGADLVMGNRFKGGIAPGAMPFLHRYLGNPVLSFVGRLFFKIPIGDFHCGLRGFRRVTMQNVGLQTTGMEFASEMVVRSALGQLEIQEVPTTLRVAGRNRVSHLRTWRDGWRHLKFLLIYSPRWLFLIPGMALVMIGLLVGGLLIAGPLSIGNVHLENNTFIMACLLIAVGTQLFTFGALARVFAARAGFLPRTKRTDFLFEWLSTERLVQIAAILMVVGLAGVGWAIWQWMKVGMGPLDSLLVPRVLLSSLCAVVISIQLTGSAFLLGVLEIPFRRVN
jgi:glycosyltransferase involved in cell wall biosynthesis